MFQMAGIGPLFGQIGYFHKFAGREYEDKRPRDHFVAESRILLRVLNGDSRPYRFGVSLLGTYRRT